MAFTTAQLQALAAQILALSACEHAQIHHILCRHGVPYTRNRNGVLVDLNRVPGEVLEQIATYVDFCKSDDRAAADYERQLYSSAHPAQPPQPARQAAQAPPLVGGGGSGVEAAAADGECELSDKLRAFVARLQAPPTAWRRGCATTRGPTQMVAMYRRGRWAELPSTLAPEPAP
jgi:hypothetical protein